MSNPYPPHYGPTEVSVAANVAEQPRRRPRWPWVIALIAILAVVWAFLDFRNEVGRWHHAAALENWSDGKQEQAQEHLDQAIEWNPRDTRSYVQRAKWKRIEGDYEGALADCNIAIERTSPTYELLIERSQILQHLGRHQEAVDDWKQIDRLSQDDGTPDRATALNGLAYAQALGKIDLDKALERAEMALKQQPDSPAILDTRGYIHFLRGELGLAEQDLNQSVKQMEDMLTRGNALFGSARPGLPEETEQQQYLSELRTSVAVIRYHRALVHEAQGKDKEAEEDLTRVRELIGREPDEHLF